MASFGRNAPGFSRFMENDRPPCWQSARIGLLGGSFNPAHEGHLIISQIALRLLALDRVWWLVSPQNPLKSPAGMAPLSDRLGSAIRQARDPRISVTAIESRLGTRFTVDTILALRRRFRKTRFVWLMGADNLEQMIHWKSWEIIFNTIPIAVFARPTYSLRALSGRAAHRFRRHRLDLSQSRELADRRPPCWIFFTSRLMPISATQLRAAVWQPPASENANSTPTGRGAPSAISKKAAAHDS